ncbi:hypothetical protein [Actinosynnema mirum]|uniref:TIR domain-containing protein n=1 Tax=Actinosynnema mirum (strain ATCC 29888 / DSM 43827 / JCM 3225 / NBRC 14064 / NCIMB 13271 / NRRL B-12336 / IMRU 3971 / 101) TaxID=446462 RepID=C6WRV0_ACTMD|nr:hypothetical protein [Actinosynnema mirum]ACU36942.1 hypothetical protein Amir_3023 [Actinosynnema mirum DSM 43827]
MQKIIFSHRPADEKFGAGLLRSTLSERFGGAAEFTANPEGTPRAEIAEASAVLLVIGRHWLDDAPEGGLLLADPADPVRATALTARDLGKRIVPVRLAVPPVPVDLLPEQLKFLASLPDVEVKSRQAPMDVEELAHLLGADDPSPEEEGADG